MAHELSRNEFRALVRLHELGVIEPHDSLVLYMTDEGEHMAPVTFRMGDGHTTLNVDVSEAIEGTLHKILHEHGTADDVRRILGLEKGDPDTDESLIPIDLGWCLRGPLWSVEVADEVMVEDLPVSPSTLLVQRDGRPLLVYDETGDPVCVPDEWDGEVMRHVGIYMGRYVDGRTYLGLATLDEGGRPWDGICDLTVNVSDQLPFGDFFRLETQLERDALSTLGRAGLAEVVGTLPYGRYLQVTQVELGARERPITQGQGG